MELTWPLALHNWISHERDIRWEDNYDTAIYISRFRGDVYGASIFWLRDGDRGRDPIMVHANFHRYKFYRCANGALYCGNESGRGPYAPRQVQIHFTAAATGTPMFGIGPAEYCDIPQKIRALVDEQLPGPIAEEVTPHLCASVRTIIADTTI